MVPDVTLGCLLSTRNMCDPGYLSVYDGKEVRIYDHKTTKIVQAARPQRVAQPYHNPVENPTTQASPRPQQRPREQASARGLPSNVEPNKLSLTHFSCPKQNGRQRLTV